MLVLEGLAVDGLARRAVARDDVAALDHEVLGDAVDGRARVGEGLAEDAAPALVAAREREEVLRGLRVAVLVDAEHERAVEALRGRGVALAALGQRADAEEDVGVLRLARVEHVRRLVAEEAHLVERALERRLLALGLLRDEGLELGPGDAHGLVLRVEGRGLLQVRLGLVEEAHAAPRDAPPVERLDAVGPEPDRARRVGRRRGPLLGVQGALGRVEVAGEVDGGDVVGQRLVVARVRRRVAVVHRFRERAARALPLLGGEELEALGLVERRQLVLLLGRELVQLLLLHGRAQELDLEAEVRVRRDHRRVALGPVAVGRAHLDERRLADGDLAERLVPARDDRAVAERERERRLPLPRAVEGLVGALDVGQRARVVHLELHAVHGVERHLHARRAQRRLLDEAVVRHVLPGDVAGGRRRRRRAGGLVGLAQRADLLRERRFERRVAGIVARRSVHCALWRFVKIRG